MDRAIVVENVGKRFRRYHADRPSTIHELLMRGFGKLAPSECFWGLREVSFSVDPGRMVAILGRNGAGKSTLLRLIGGVGRVDEGSVRVRGRIRALLTLGAGFHPELTGHENLYVNAIIGGLTRREVDQRVNDIIAFAELEEYMGSPLRAYSTGMQMRLAFSIAIHAEPDVLLIDEVLAVGDMAFQQKCFDRIMRLKAAGCTIIVVSHDTGMAQSVCDEALYLRAGRLEAHGDPRSVVAKYQADAEGVGSGHLPVANFSPAGNAVASVT